MVGFDLKEDKHISNMCSVSKNDDEQNESIFKDQILANDNIIIESCARSPFPVQANETSDKSPQTDNSSRKGMKTKRKLDSIRLGAILPDIISYGAWTNTSMY